MTITFAESFDWITTASGGALTARGYSLTGTSSTFSRAAGRINGGSLKLDSATARLHAITKGLPAAYASGYFSFSVKINTSFSTTNVADIVRLNNSTTVQLALQLESTGRLSVLRGGTSLGQTAGAVLSPDTWHRIELYFVIHDTTGAYELRVDGVNVLSATGVDTRNGTPTTVDTFQLSHPLRAVANTAIQYDDITFNDTTGSVNNSFLGDLHIESVRPDADDSVTWTRSAGSNNFALVDESGGLDTTDYVTAATAIEDRYGLSDLAANPNAILGVQAIFHGSKDDAGACNVRSRIVSGSDISDGTAHALTTGAAIYTDLIETDPQGGGAWTGARVNAAKLAIERTT